MIAFPVYAQQDNAQGSRARGKFARYKFSVDVPTPDPTACAGQFDYSGTTHDDLRGQAGSAGQTFCLSGNTRYEGGFDWSASDPYGNSDDSTLVVTDGSGGFWIRDVANTEGDPVNLKWWERYAQNKDVYHWFTSMASGIGSGGSLYMKAGTVAGIDTVLQGSAINWTGTYGIKTFAFLEDTDTLVVHMKQGATGGTAWWNFQDYDWIKVGGDNLWLIFKGDHTGLAMTNYSIEETPGMINLDLNDGYSAATLVDWRANIHDTRRSGLNFTGRQAVNAGVAGRVAEVHMAGEMWNGGVRVNGGVRNIHWDPDRSSSRDPYLTAQGWDGTTATGTTVNGVDSLACPNPSFREFRQRGGAGGAFFADKVTGGTEVEYGSASVSHFATDQIGNGPNDPFVIKYHNMGSTGPTARTGRPHGYIGKTYVLQTVYKTDPLPIYTGDGKERRHVKFIQLENDHANGTGFVNGGVTGAGCTFGTGNTGYSRFWLPEASRDGVSSQYVTFNVNAVFERPGGTQVINDNWVGLGSGFGTAQMQGSGADCGPPGPTACDRTYGHHMRVMSPNEFGAGIGMLDADTLSGTGIVNNVSLVDPGTLTDGAGTDYCRDNVIGIAAVGNLTVNGDITIDNDCDGTIIDSIIMPSTASIVASATFTCLGEGVLAAQTWDLNNASHRTSLGATGGDPYTICTP